MYNIIGRSYIKHTYNVQHHLRRSQSLPGTRGSTPVCAHMCTFLGNHYNLYYVGEEDDDDSHSELFLLLNYEHKWCCVIGVSTVKILFSTLLRQRNANEAFVTKHST